MTAKAKMIEHEGEVEDIGEKRGPGFLHKRSPSMGRDRDEGAEAGKQKNYDSRQHESR